MKKRPEESVEVPLSTLIDVVFLLIIFFIVTANIQNEVVDHQINLADSYFVEPEEVPLTMTINIRNRGEAVEPHYSVNGTTLSLRQINAQLLRLRMNGNGMPVTIRASQDIAYREVDEVNRMILSAGFTNVRHAMESRKE